jgi:CheY-like chemotaxis protein
MLLEILDEDVRVAYDGKSALEIVVAFKPEVVFLDIGMPGMDGYETVRASSPRARTFLSSP